MLTKRTIILKAGCQLGLAKMALIARYKFGLMSGYYRRRTPIGGVPQPDGLKLTNTGIKLPWREDLAAVLDPDGGKLLRHSDKICIGQVALFGGNLTKLQLVVPGELQHWTQYQSAQFDGKDIKWTWEAGRFGWAMILARAYFLSRERKHVNAFWDFTESFLAANPPNLGPHWASAQEVAIRLICLAYCGQLLGRAKESTNERKAMLAEAIAQHAERISHTLTYARAQNNNHLLTEALGLYTAGIVLPEHPNAQEWRELGWKWFNRGLQSQIAEDGAYMQHSVNYQRLMLQTGLWATALAKGQGDKLPVKSRQRLGAATNWLLSLVDHETGRVPNFGPNDGAYIFPFSILPFNDYRPILQAAAQAFLGERPFEDGIWDEEAILYGNMRSQDALTEKPVHKHRLEGKHSWAYLRAVKFSDRPGHADQLHLDLWWHGINIAQDAGTFLYNAKPPWDNALAGTSVHNTVTIAGRDQMTRAGRFLWLDWAQAKIIDTRRDAEGQLIQVTAEHNGYRKLGVTQRRAVENLGQDRWQIIDTLDGRRESVQARLLWLLPDWPWELDGSDLRIKSPHGWVSVSVKVTGKNGAVQNVQLARAGELLAGSGEVDAIMGWVSPTYADKQPALSFAVNYNGLLPLQITSIWEFPT